MLVPVPFMASAVGAISLGLQAEAAPAGKGAPERFGLYYSGSPCAGGHIDRTYSQFQVNLGREPRLLRGRLLAGPDGEARLVREGGVPLRLLTNASRADWLLSYPLIGGEVGVWGRPILRPDCTIVEDAFYLESLFPPALLEGVIDPALEVPARGAARGLLVALRAYGATLQHSARAFVSESGDNDADDGEDSAARRGSADDLEEALFDPDLASSEAPWRVRLLGGDEELPPDTSVEVVLSGSDGSTGMFGHIAVGAGGQVYNVYPKGSERGSPEPVPLWDYLFNAQRGQALRRPNWILRLEGLPPEAVAALRGEVLEEIRAIQVGRAVYHPTANNCTSVSMRALLRLGFRIPAARYFTRRFPRPAFAWVLARLPRLIATGTVVPKRIEILFVPQVPTRISVGGAPNRPLRDRSRIPPQADSRAAFEPAPGSENPLADTHPSGK